MSMAYELDRCRESSWRGEGTAPGRNRCMKSRHTPHEVHRDECGNNFTTDKAVVTIGRTYR